MSSHLKRYFYQSLILQVLGYRPPSSFFSQRCGEPLTYVNYMTTWRQHLQLSSSIHLFYDFTI